MQRWIKAAAGLMLALTLTFILNGKAYADGDPALPETPPAVIENIERTTEIGETDFVQALPETPESRQSEAPAAASAGIPDDNDQMLMLAAHVDADPAAADILTDTAGSIDNGTDGVGNTATTSFTQTEDGSFILVNHDGTEIIGQAGGEVTILAAGLNRISGISASTVHVAGTGILLVDSLEGELDLLTFTDIYDEGSAAVFVRQPDGSYLLVNGEVPGLLDEEYALEDLTLVVPDQTSLLLCGTGAELLEDGSVAYYHGMDHDYTCNNLEQVVEMTGKLTIGGGAALRVNEGGSIRMQDLKSVSLGDDSLEQYEINYTKLHTEIVVTGDGELLMNGSLAGGGAVYIGEDASLSGSGSLSADIVFVDAPAAMENSELIVSATALVLNGSGEIAGLHIQDTCVFQESGAILLSGLQSAGESAVVLPAASTLDLSAVEGTLSLQQKKYMAKYSTADTNTVTGTISGDGTISFQSGLYNMTATLNGVQLSTAGGGIVYDYADSGSRNPLHRQPDELSMPANDVIPVEAFRVDEYNELSGVKRIALSDTTVTAPSGIPAGVVSGTRQLDLSALKGTLGEWENDIVVELVKKTGDTLSSVFITELSGTVSAEDVCLVRVYYVLNWETVAPAGPMTTTNTSFTGSGILGGSGAGSVHFGRPNNVNTEDNESDENSENTVVVTPTEDDTSFETREAATGEEIQAQQIAVWVEAKTAAAQGVHFLHASINGVEILSIRGVMLVRMAYTPVGPALSTELYVVFRNEDGSLHAVKAHYAAASGELIFETDRLGAFVVVGLDYDGEVFSEAFYEALGKLDEVKKLS